MSTGGIFNLPEPKGVDQVRAETTAAQAQFEAPTSSVARAIGKNADQAQEAARDAALAAKSLGDSFTGEPPSAMDEVQQQAKATTDAAVAEGKRDVAVATAASQGYLDRTKNFVSSALATAQSYLPSNGTAASGDTPSSAQGVVNQLQAGVSTAVETGKEYLSAAQKTAQPHIDKATAATSEYVKNINGQMDSTNSTPALKEGIPATSAPLENGPHTAGSPYPSTTTTTGTNVGA